MRTIKHYQDFFAKINISLDHAQLDLIKQLIKLETSITRNNKSKFFTLFNKTASLNQLKGIYIYGKVGRGKTLIADSFFKFINIDNKLKIHFNEFMLNIHQQIHELQSTNGTLDPLQIIAKNLNKKYKLIFLDELQITDIADAMIVGRLFKLLFKLEVFIVITSNRIPDDLYKNGLQREYFLEFISLIKQHLNVHELASECDYRLTKITSSSKRYIYPLNDETDLEINNIITTLIDDGVIVPKVIDVNGRKFTLKNTYKNIVICSFDELCNQSLGASDYIQLCTHFDILILKDVPILGSHNRNEAKRFTILIDAVYEKKILLFCTANSKPTELYNQGDGLFEFERTVSRLIEIQSEEYLQQYKQFYK
jgi:cell division protein ZapE